MAYADYLHCPGCDGKTIYVGDREEPAGVEAWHTSCLEPLIGHKNPPEADDSCPDCGRSILAAHCTGE